MDDAIDSIHPFFLHPEKVDKPLDTNSSSYDFKGFLDIGYFGVLLIVFTYVLYFTYKFIREHTHVTANCWFCNENTKVLFKERKEWTCSSCQQFNGFNAEGDYTKQIPEQYNKQLNSTVRYTYYDRNTKSVPPSNGLCRTCNTNQELKIRQIASYVPLDENNYDEEISSYKKRLEKSYKLCSSCETTVQNTLQLKTNLYASKILNKRSKKGDTDVHQSFRRWRNRFIFIILILLVFLIWKYHYTHNEINVWSNTSLSLSVVLDNIEYYFSHSDNNFYLDIVTTLSYLIGSKMVMNKIVTFFTAIAVGVIFLNDGKIPSVLKIIFTTISIVTCLILYLKRWTTKPNVPLKKISRTKKDKNLATKKIIEISKNSESVEKISSEDHEEIALSKNLNVSVLPTVCGTLSGLSIGNEQQIHSANISTSSSYLFQRNKPLIQPAKLMVSGINENIDSIRSTPTASSGYDSISYVSLKKSGQISEFDSVSQVNNRYSVKNVDRYDPRNSSLLRYNHDALGENYYGTPSIRSCRDISSSSSINISQAEVSATCSSIQLFLFCFSFFMLGCSIQMAKTYFKL